MAEEELNVNTMSSSEGVNQRSKDKKAKRGKNKRIKQLLERNLKAEDEQAINGKCVLVGEDPNPSVEMTENGTDIGSAKGQKKKRKKHLLIETDGVEEEKQVDREEAPARRKLISYDGIAEHGQNEKEHLLEEAKCEEEQEMSGVNPLLQGNLKSNSGEADNKKEKMKKRLLKEAAKANNRGVCYLSRIPPHMDHVKLRQILSQYGEIQRIYLAPEGPATQVHRKRAGGFRGQVFSEGWVEFTKKSVAKSVANMLNGEQIGGRKRSSFYYDIWNIKYLTKFKWDDLTAEIAYKSAVREQKLPLVFSAAKRERDFYLSKVEKSHALNAIEERMKKKQKSQQEAGIIVEVPVSQPKVIRQFPQKEPVADAVSQSKPKLSKDILAGIFGCPQ